jgi:hypothetical protein
MYVSFHQEKTTLADFIYYTYLKRTARMNVAIGMMLKKLMAYPGDVSPRPM